MEANHATMILVYMLYVSIFFTCIEIIYCL